MAFWESSDGQTAREPRMFVHKPSVNLFVTCAKTYNFWRRAKKKHIQIHFPLVKSFMQTEQTTCRYTYYSNTNSNNSVLQYMYTVWTEHTSNAELDFGRSFHVFFFLILLLNNVTLRCTSKFSLDRAKHSMLQSILRNPDALTNVISSIENIASEKCNALPNFKTFPYILNDKCTRLTSVETL